MKLFQQLLLAPAALGLLAPVAAQAADMNLDGINKYAGAEEQVTSISQFSDVKPTDWAYQALSNLIERYGCVAGYPNGTYKGGQAMTRYEAAALLNACLDRISEVTDELKRLMKEFEKELAVLRGRVDGLEAKVGELEATQFSTTTKLKGIATFVIGGNSFNGTNNAYLNNPFVPGYPGLGGLAPTNVVGAALGGGATLSPVGMAFTPTPLPTGILAVPTSLQVSGTPAFMPLNALNYNGGYNASFAAINGLVPGNNLNPIPPVYAPGTVDNGIPLGAFGTVSPVDAFGNPIPGVSTSNLTYGAKGLTDAVRTGGNTLAASALLGNLASIFALSFPGASSTSFNYDVRLGFDTSFTGKDLLKTTLRASNLSQSGFGYQVGVGGFSFTALNNLEVNPGLLCNTGVGNCGDTVSINRLYYQFPIGANLTATVGAKVRQDDMLAIWPSAYPADTVLDQFTLAGAPGVYSLNTGGGAGLSWKSNGFGVSVNYVVQNAAGGNPSNQFFTGQTQGANPSNVGGLLNSASQSTLTAQLGYAGSNWGAALGYTYGQNYWTSAATPFAQLAAATTGGNSNYGISAYWQPSTSGWVPSISAGYGYTTFANDNYFNSTYGYNAFGSGALSPGVDLGFGGARAQSWYVGLQWSDVFLRGNSAGLAVGQASFLTSLGTNGGFGNLLAAAGANGNASDSNLNWEFWYKFQVTDNISVTPAVFYLNNPLGQVQNVVGYSTGGSNTFNNFGALVKTTFRF
ncbi:MAG: iron uptake porin [Synechococcaceae cyanobacterium]|jgi:hypothetical protein